METQLTVHPVEHERASLPSGLVASKLVPPFARPGIVERDRLLAYLYDQPVPPVTPLYGQEVTA